MPPKSLLSHHRSSLCALLLVLVSILGCSLGSLNSPPRGQYGFTAEEKQQQADKQMAKKVVETRAAVQKIPGPKQYKDYTLALCDAYNNDIFARDVELSPQLDDASALGDRIATKAPYEAHNIMAFKGLLLLCSGDGQSGEAALLQSLEIRPGRDAGEVLAVLYGSSGEFIRVGETCAQVIPALGAQDRFMMMETCKEQLHATSDESAFYWARQEDIDFWNAEQGRRAEAARQRAVAEEKQRAVILEQQREAWRQQREANQRAQRERNQRDICVAQCTQTAHICNKDCYNEHCTFSCNQAYDACQDACRLRY